VPQANVNSLNGTHFWLRIHFIKQSSTLLNSYSIKQHYSIKLPLNKRYVLVTG